MPPARAERLLVLRIPIMVRTHFSIIIKKPKYKDPVRGDLASQTETGKMLAESLLFIFSSSYH